MQFQVIRNATLKVTYGDRVFITGPYFAPKHSQEPLIDYLSLGMEKRSCFRMR
jgi:hypothetical protein